MTPTEVSSLKAILDRVCGEYREMPGLRLTRPQAQRLWGLDEQTCNRILAALLQSGFLRETYDGRYARPMDEPVLRTPLKVSATAHDRRSLRRSNVRAS
jgi:hypothetical protein